MLDLQGSFALFRCFSLRLKTATRRMSDKLTNYQFTQKTNPTTGQQEWVAEIQDEHDYATDIARSSYADMLHDTERNQLYYKAIRHAVEAIHKRGEKAKVLDIGTGTGLLSMMAARAGAEQITAIEVFTPMADIAKKVTMQNGFPDIKVINKHSTEVLMGDDGDMKELANILVTELFDTELIGEGALSAYQHAHKYLMEENCLAVPHRAVTYASVVESDLMLSWHQLNPISISRVGGRKVQVLPDDNMRNSHGVPAVHDIQLSQFPRAYFREITKPIKVFDFEWASKSLSDHPRSSVSNVEVIASGQAQVVLSWWELKMDVKGEFLLSTAPRWHHPDPKSMQWRDHWIQSVYFLPKKLSCKKGDHITLKAFHDSYSLWFEASSSEEADDVISIERPPCDYPPRVVWSRSRLGRINDTEFNKLFIDALDDCSSRLPTRGVALCISDFSLLSLFAVQTCFVGREVIALEQSKIAQRGLINLARHNNLNVEVVSGNPASISSDLEGRKIAMLAGEPFFTSSYLPWNDLYFWYARSELDSYLHPRCQIMPCKAHICAAAVYFEDLWKIRAPVNTVEGFDVSAMDEMIERALELKEYHEPEPHSLWEYPNQLLSAPQRIMSFDFTDLVPKTPVTSVGSFQIRPRDLTDSQSQHCHGVVLWMEYDLDKTRTISTGSQPASDNGDFSKTDTARPCWCMHYKQAVFLFKRPFNLFNEKHLEINVDYDVTFQPRNGDVKMKFTVPKLIS